MNSNNLLLKEYIKQIISSQLNEIHYEEVRISKGWQQFFEKYGSEEKVKNLGYDIDDIFVNFVGRNYRSGGGESEYVPDIINKKMVTDKDSASNKIYKHHNDPTGIYAYPLEYILSHPLSEKYGIGTGIKYIRVLLNLRKTDDNNNDDNNTGKKIDIHKIKTIEQVRDILLKAGELHPIYKQLFAGKSTDDISNFINFFKNNYFSKYIGKAKSEDVYPKILVFLLSHDLSQITPQFTDLAFSEREIDINDDPSDVPKIYFRERMGDEQTKLWKHIGFDVLSDDSRDNEFYSAINAYEPTQTVFLRRNAFKILDIYEKISGKMYDESNARNVNLEKLAAKSAAFIFSDKNIRSIKKYINEYEVFTKNKMLMSIRVITDTKMTNDIMYPNDSVERNKSEKIGNYSPFNHIEIVIKYIGNEQVVLPALVKYSLRPDEKLSDALPIIKRMYEDKIKELGIDHAGK
jgi:hypothetical protein